MHYSFFIFCTGFYGKTSLEAAQIDCIIDVCDDIITKGGDIYHYQGPGQFDKDRFVVEVSMIFFTYPTLQKL